MKAELVTEDRLNELWEAWWQEYSRPFGLGGPLRLGAAEEKASLYVGFLLGARTALDELRIVEVIELPENNAFGFEIQKGAVLVKAKENLSNGGDYEYTIGFDADAPRGAAWTAVVRDPSGDVAAVSAGHGSAEKAIQAGKAWVKENGK